MNKAQDLINNVSEISDSKIDVVTLAKVQKVISKYDKSAKVEAGSIIGMDVVDYTSGGIFDHGRTLGARIGTRFNTFCLHTTSSHWDYAEAIRIQKEVNNCMKFLSDIKKVASKLVK